MRVKKEKWITLESFKIYDGGLWELQEPDNSLSDLIEIAKLEYLGISTEDGRLYKLYVCNDVPDEVLELVKKNIGEDSHVYFAVSMTDIGQTAMLWPY